MRSASQGCRSNIGWQPWFAQICRARAREQAARRFLQRVTRFSRPIMRLRRPILHPKALITGNRLSRSLEILLITTGRAQEAVSQSKTWAEATTLHDLAVEYRLDFTSFGSCSVPSNAAQGEEPCNAVFRATNESPIDTQSSRQLSQTASRNKALTRYAARRTARDPRRIWAGRRAGGQSELPIKPLLSVSSWAYPVS